MAKGLLKKIAAGVVMAAAGLAGSARSEILPINSFAELYQNGSSKILGSVRTPAVENVMYRTNHDDPSSDIVLPKSGYYDSVNKTWVGEKWDFGLYMAGNGSTIGYGNNNNGTSNRYPGYEGFMSGKLSATIGEGNRPDYIFMVHDVLGDGIGNYDTSTGVLNIPGSDGEVYTEMDILWGPNQLRGNITDFSGLDLYATNYLPKMVVSQKQPGDATYYNGVRDGKIGSDGNWTSYSDLEDMVTMTENWLRTDCSPQNFWGNGADWNTDGKVDMADYALMASKFNSASQ